MPGGQVRAREAARTGRRPWQPRRTRRAEPPRSAGGPPLREPSPGSRPGATPIPPPRTHSPSNVASPHRDRPLGRLRRSSAASRPSGPAPSRRAVLAASRQAAERVLQRVRRRTGRHTPRPVDGAPVSVPACDRRIRVRTRPVTLGRIDRDGTGARPWGARVRPEAPQNARYRQRAIARTASSPERSEGTGGSAAATETRPTRQARADRQSHVPSPRKRTDRRAGS